MGEARCGQDPEEQVDQVRQVSLLKENQLDAPRQPTSYLMNRWKMLPCRPISTSYVPEVKKGLVGTSGYATKRVKLSGISI